VAGTPICPVFYLVSSISPRRRHPIASIFGDPKSTHRYLQDGISIERVGGVWCTSNFERDIVDTSWHASRDLGSTRPTGPDFLLCKEVGSWAGEVQPSDDLVSGLVWLWGVSQAGTFLQPSDDLVSGLVWLWGVSWAGEVQPSDDLVSGLVWLWGVSRAGTFLQPSDDLVSGIVWLWGVSRAGTVLQPSDDLVSGIVWLLRCFTSWWSGRPECWAFV
jgi:hypothetical protein